MKRVELPLFLNSLPHALVTVDPAGQVVIGNDLFRTLFHKGQVGIALSQLFSRNPLITDAFTRVIKTGGSLSLREVEIQPDAQQPRTMDVEAFPMVDNLGTLLGAGFLFHDRPAATHFEEQQRRLDRIRFLRTLASGLAHEIKNPLSGILGASQLLAQQLTHEPELKEYAQIIHKEVKRVDTLIREILHFTKERKAVRKPVNVNALLHDIIVLEKTAAATVKFVQDLDPSLPPVSADGESLSQVFLNLIRNAIQAMPKKGSLTVRSRFVTDYTFKKGQKRRQVIGIDIEDTGVGIEPKDLTNIFVPFFTTKASGTGLGLPICQKIVEDHEGHIEVASTKGIGTTVSVYLPV